MFSNADLVFEDAIDKDGNAHPLTQGTFIKYLESDDRKLRESALEMYKHMVLIIIRLALR